MAKIKAYIKDPTGKVFAVDVKDCNLNEYGMAAIVSEDDITYVTHAVNVLLVEKTEVPECESKE